MDKRIIISVVFTLFGLISFSQEIEESYVWDAHKKLTWNDFKGSIPPDAIPAATTASGISYTYSANFLHHEVQLDFEVNAFFYPNESWYKPAVCNNLILSHEQLHFDISELFARKMRKRLRETSFSDNVKAEIKSIYNKTLKELSDFQDRYDWETNFSRNREQQLRWNTQVAEALERAN